MSRINSAWKMNSPKPNPAIYSITRSSHIGNPRAAVTAAATTMPVASPAAQWTTEPKPCFHNGFTNSSCSPGPGSLHDSTYSTKPMRPR